MCLPAQASTLGTAQGLLTLGGVSIPMSGTCDQGSFGLVLQGGGYTFNGKATIANGALAVLTGALTTDASGQAGATASFTPATADPKAGTFTTTGSLAQARTGHSATLLTNGKVLVVGGAATTSGGYSRLATAEMYDPASGAFSTTGSLNSGTAEHSAVLLADGTVLIIGGRDKDDAATSRVERYDPATGRFTVQNGLNHARCLHPSATLLPNGKVLVTGGVSVPGGASDSSVAIAELYEPDASDGPNANQKGKSTDTGNMVVGRYWHVAMMNPSNANYVLMLGGLVGGDGGNSTLTEEAYDVSTGHFSTIQPTPAVKRGAGSLIYLGGMRWLSAGGYNFDANTVLSSAEIIDGSTNGGAGSITPTGSMPMAISMGSASLLPDGRVLIAGGFSDISTMAGLSTAVLFNPAGAGGAGTFSATTNGMGSARRLHTATLLLDGRILLVGGQTGADGTELATAELYH